MRLTVTVAYPETKDGGELVHTLAPKKLLTYSNTLRRDARIEAGVNVQPTESTHDFEPMHGKVGFVMFNPMNVGLSRKGRVFMSPATPLCPYGAEGTFRGVQGHRAPPLPLPAGT